MSKMGQRKTKWLGAAAHRRSVSTGIGALQHSRESRTTTILAKRDSTHLHTRTTTWRRAQQVDADVGGAALTEPPATKQSHKLQPWK